MTKEELLETIKGAYQDHEDIDYVIEEVENTYDNYLGLVATTVFKSFQDKDLASKVLDAAINELEQKNEFEAYQFAAEGIVIILEDEDRARSILSLGLERFPETANYITAANLAAGDINSPFERNRNEAIQLLQKAEKFAKTSKHFNNIANGYYRNNLHLPEDYGDEYDESKLGEQEEWTHNLYSIAYVLEEDKDYKKYIREDIEENGLILGARTLNKIGKVLVKEKGLN